MAQTAVDRRDFLLMRVNRTDAVVLSCESLYMRYVDARASGATATLFDNLQSDLHGVKKLRLIKTSWLADEDLSRELDRVLAGFRADGGRVEH
jgi:hypothetical protein